MARSDGYNTKTRQLILDYLIRNRQHAVSASIWSRIVFTLVGVAAICGIPGLFTDETGE